MSLIKNNNAEKERMYFPELDGLRFFAFLLVFIHHTDLFGHIPVLSAVKENGWIGVDLFFALSAYLFTKLLIAEHDKTGRISFKKFYIRRIFRIWPIFFLFVLFSIAFYVFIQHNVIDSYIRLRIIGLFTFTDNLFSSTGGYSPLPFTKHLWTIAYEEQFYVFIPLGILLLVRSSGQSKVVYLISIVVVFILVRIYMIEKEIQHPAIWVLPCTHFESIILGIVIGFGGMDFLKKLLNPLFIGIIGVLLFGLISAMPVVNVINHQLHITYLLVGLGSAMVLFATIHSNVLSKMLSIRVFVFLGKRSYGLYVYHILGTFYAEYIIYKFAWLPSGSLALFIYALLFTVIVSVISYRLIETPFLKLKKKFEVVVSRPI